MSFGPVHATRQMAQRQRQQQQRRGGVDPHVMMLGGHVLERIRRLERKPPVTLALMALNAALWLLPGVLLSGADVRFCPSQLVAGHHPPSWALMSKFIHANDGGWHLYYNMAALLTKGVLLELSMGSEAFGVMILSLVLLTSVIFMGVSYVLTVVLGIAETYNNCSVGFSGVLFGLSVAVHHSPTVAQVQPVPGVLRGFLGPTMDKTHLVWAELVVRK